MKIKDEIEPYITTDGLILTKSQTTVLGKMIDWADTDSNKDIVFTLTGFAGVGKTTLVESFLKEIIKKYSYYTKSNVCVTAPTHKAKKIIAKKTGFRGKTAQALLGLRPNVELEKFNVNLPIFAVLGDEQIQDYNIIVVDECSMMNRALDVLMRNRAKFWHTKILYVGDQYQLPPVGEKLSTTFTHVNNIEHLTEIVRQEKGNPLLELIGKVRNDIINGTNKAHTLLMKPLKDINDKGQGYNITNNVKDVQDVISDIYRDSVEYETNKEYIKFIAWTNPNVKEWNEYIRNTIFRLPKTLITHEDLLMGYRSVPSKTNKLAVINSEEYVIKAYSNSVNKFGIKGFKVTLENDNKAKIQVYIVARSSYPLFSKLHEERVAKAKANTRFWKQYYEFKHDNLLMDDVRTGDGTLVCKKDLDYGYSCTIHKTQGSTYNTVIINGKNINKNSNRLERLKLWYVALSRASKQAIVYI